MKRIAFVGAKGGVGKTTSAMLTAAALASTNEPVAVVDTDPQESARAWARTAQESVMPLPFPVIAGGLDFAKRVPTDVEWAVLDTPPGDQKIIQAAAKWADLIILPTRPGALEMLQLGPVLDLARTTNTPAAVLVTQARAGVKENEETAEALSDAGAFVFDAQIPMRARTARLPLVHPSIRDLEASGYMDIAKEIIGAFSE